MKLAHIRADSDLIRAGSLSEIESYFYNFQIQASLNTIQADSLRVTESQIFEIQN